MSTRSGISIQEDFTELAFLTGKAKGMAKKMSTNAYLSDLVLYTHGEMTRRFDQYMEVLYQTTAGRKQLHHVYEWRVDSKAGQLWRHKLTGQGGQRSATWDWKASKANIPTPSEARGIEGHPMQTVPKDMFDEIIKNRGWTKRYVFHWKAPVMESGQEAIIQPRVPGGKIMYPTGNPDEPVAWKTESQINPGGEETTGGFTRAWIAWWSTEAPRVFEDAIAPEVERNAVDSVRRGARKRQGTISVNAMTDYKTLMKHGEQWATYYIDRHQRQMRLRERRNAR